MLTHSAAEIRESKITRRVRIATGKRCFLARAGLSVNYSF
jgi:hypothetical protein|uniref:Uncharacterized protein n=1 Tax=Siphoviridae sp. ct6oU4 TaxID=2826299 RepID=A0A8S5QQT9_9CAUD|nr:MAG TPA: hypothetical protein [Siphoviridae sp. ct6oU4]